MLFHFAGLTGCAHSSDQLHDFRHSLIKMVYFNARQPRHSKMEVIRIQDTVANNKLGETFRSFNRCLIACTEGTLVVEHRCDRMVTLISIHETPMCGYVQLGSGL